MKRYAIYGAGSLGTVLGAYITQNGGQIDLINRNKAHVEALKANIQRNHDRYCGFEMMDDLNNYETDMKFPYVPGILEFVKEIRSIGIKTALVTSSNELKMSKVYNKLPGFTQMFDVIITAAHMTKSKPDPQCYLLAADKLGVPYSQCVVFEDSFAGIRAGMNAKMTTIGVSTTNPKEEIESLCDMVIPNFCHFGYRDLMDALEKYKKI